MTDVKTETPTVELTLAPTLDAAPVPTLGWVYFSDLFAAQADDLLEQLAFDRLRLPDLRRRQATLEQRDARVQAGDRLA